MDNDTEAIAPATWSIEQIRQVSGLYCVVMVADELLERDREAVLDLTRSKLAKRLVQDAHPFGVEVHPGDVDYRFERLDSFPFQLKLRAGWRPSTKEVELRGGVADGTVIAIQKVGDSLMVPTYNEAAWMSEDVEPATALTPMSVRYELVGWSERHRRWVYKPVA